MTQLRGNYGGAYNCYAENYNYNETSLEDNASRQSTKSTRMIFDVDEKVMKVDREYAAKKKAKDSKSRSEL